VADVLVDGDSVGPVTSHTFTNVTADHTISASFALKTYTLTYLAGTGGSISGTTPQSVTHGSSGSAVTAVPDTDYQFVDWSDGLTDNPRTDTNVTANVTVTAEFAPFGVPVLTFTSPSGLAYHTSPDTLTVGWESDRDLSVGEFGIWARSATGSWYGGKVVATAGGDTYSTTLSLAGVPAGFYQVIIGYRPTSGSGDWTAFATSYGFVFAVNAPPAPVVEITAPLGEQELTSTSSLTVSWSTQTAFSTGQFALWVRSPQGIWHWAAPLIPANGTTSYQTIIDLDEVAPAITSGLGYQVIVAYEPMAYTGFWMSWATSPGVFAVDASVPEIEISAPQGIASYETTDSVTASWTCDQDLNAGQFGVWLRSADGTGWYKTQLVPAAGDAGTVYNITLSLAGVPDGLGYEVIVAYRPVAGTGAFMSWATSPGNFSVNMSAPVLTMVFPSGSGTYAVGDGVPVSWNSPALDTGEFGLWLRSPEGDWYWHPPLIPATGADYYYSPVPLTVPSGTGYQAVVAWRPVVGTGAFVSWAESPGTFTVLSD